MHISNHASIRIGERTSLSVKEVQEIIAGGYFAALPRGEDDKEYCLFYSYPDEEFYIAVISECTLISVLYGWHKIPVKAKSSEKKEAVRAWRRYIIDKTKPNPFTDQIEARVEVCVGGEAQFRHPLGLVTREQLVTPIFLQVFHELLMTLSSGVTAWRQQNDNKDRVTYQVWVKFPHERSFIKTSVFAHGKLLNRLQSLDNV